MTRSYKPSRKNTGKRVRVRSKRLDKLDETKFSLALWLLAKQILEDSSETASADRKPKSP
jgi:hypothetical protein